VIPRSIEDITPEWLTDALGGAGFLTSDRVETIRFSPTGEGLGFIGEIAKLVVGYSKSPNQGPRTLVAKLAVPNHDVRQFADRAGLYEAEIRFYKELGKNPGIRVPQFYFGDADSGYFVLLLEDLSHLRVGDETRPGSVADAYAAVRNIACLHAHWWDRQELAELQWLHRPQDPVAAQSRQQVYLEAWSAVSRQLETFLHPDVHEIGARLGPKLAQVWSNTSTGALTLNHGDYRLANLFFDGDQVVTFDWQFVNQGPPALDLADLLVWSLTNDQRDTHQAALIELYVATLEENGVQNYTQEEVLQDCALGMLRNLENYVVSIRNLAMDDHEGGAWIDAVSPRMVVLADWDCAKLIPV